MGQPRDVRVLWRCHSKSHVHEGSCMVPLRVLESCAPAEDPTVGKPSTDNSPPHQTSVIGAQVSTQHPDPSPPTEVVTGESCSEWEP